MFWALAGSGLSLRRAKTEGRWRADCPRDPAHTLSIAYRRLAGRTDAAVFLRCHDNANGYEDSGCPTLAVLTALGCSWRDLYQADAEGRCQFCGSPGYRVAGVARGKPVCLVHLLDETGQPRALVLAEAKA